MESICQHILLLFVFLITNAAGVKVITTLFQDLYGGQSHCAIAFFGDIPFDISDIEVNVFLSKVIRESKCLGIWFLGQGHPCICSRKRECQ